MKKGANKITGANSRPAWQFEGRGLRRRALVVGSHGRHYGGAAVAQFCRSASQSERPSFIKCELVERGLSDFLAQSSGLFRCGPSSVPFVVPFDPFARFRAQVAFAASTAQDCPQVAGGACRGVCFLHESESVIPIIFTSAWHNMSFLRRTRSLHRTGSRRFSSALVLFVWFHVIQSHSQPVGELRC